MNILRKEIFISGKLLEWELVIFLLLVTLFNIPYFNSSFLPLHDTLTLFLSYYFFYNHSFFNHELPLWLPYAMYGVPSMFYELVRVSPSSYLTGIVGLILGVKNPLVLFKFSFLIDQWIFIAGTYFLSRKLFEKRGTVILVCLSSIFLLVWQISSGFNFHIFYLLPWIIYCQFLFFETERAEILWVSGILCIVTFLGNAPYFASLYLLILVVVFLVLCRGRFHLTAKLIQPSKSNLIWFSLFAAVTFLYLYNLNISTESIRLFLTGRDPESAHAEIENFLTYGPGIGGPDPVWVALGGPIQRDNSHYFGLLPIIFLFWAILRVRSVSFFAIFLPGILLLWISFGGFFATAIFNLFPGFSYYRHIGLVFGVVKFFFIMAAGFGLDHFARNFKARHFLWVIPLLIFGADLVGAEFWRPYLITLFGGNNSKIYLDRVWVPIFFVRFFFYLGGAFFLYMYLRNKENPVNSVYSQSSSKPSKILWMVFGACLMVDVISYQYLLKLRLPNVPPKLESKLYTMEVDRLNYQKARHNEPFTQRQEDILELLKWPKFFVNYALYYNWAQMDMCYPKFRTNWMMRNVYTLLREGGGNPTLWPKEDFLPKENRSLRKIFGCDSPKLWWAPELVLAENEDHAFSLVKNSSQLDQKVILSLPDDKRITDLKEEERPLPGTKMAGRVEVIEYTSNQLVLKATVEHDSPGWLIYSEPYHPEWRAYRDGEEIPLWLAYGAFKAVRVPPGTHEIRFQYGSLFSKFSAYFFPGISMAVILTLLLITFINATPSIRQSRWVSKNRILKPLVMADL